MTKVEEPEWDPENRSWVKAKEHHDAMLCPCGCGYPASVSQDPANEDKFDADLPIRCHARTALVRAQERLSDDVPQVEALLFERPKLRAPEQAESGPGQASQHGQDPDQA